MPNIEDLFTSVPGVRQDWRVDWREDAKADWKIDWDSVPGDLPGAAPLNTVLPVISGVAQDAMVLSVSTGTWTGNPVPTFTYQWMVDGSPVSGQTANAYTVVTADVGFMVTCEVTGTNSEGFVTVSAVDVGPVIA